MAKKIKYKVGGGCVLCMTCVYECPMQAITIHENVSAYINESKCVGCGSCFDNCQPSAIIPVTVEE